MSSRAFTLTATGGSSLLSDSADTRALFVFNTGNRTVYLGSDYSVSPNAGIPLLPGASLPWGSGRQIYACSDGAGVGNALVTDDIRDIPTPGQLGRQADTWSQSYTSTLFTAGTQYSLVNTAPGVTNGSNLAVVTVTNVGAPSNNYTVSLYYPTLGVTTSVLATGTVALNTTAVSSATISVVTGVPYVVQFKTANSATLAAGQSVTVTVELVPE